NNEGISIDSRKVEVVQNFSTPTNLRQLYIFLGLSFYYRWFIKDFSKVAAPIYELLKKDTRYIWTKVQSAFQFLKKSHVTASVLAYLDFLKEFLLFIDASSMALSTILSQKNSQGKEKDI
ncbi:19389_t:CDS:1, partial [Gigaspora rosea]